MSNSYKKAKGRSSGRGFTAKPHHIFRPDFVNGKPSPASTLSHMAAHLLDNLCSQYNGINNGDFSAAPKITKLYGWRSQGSVDKALKELLAKGFIEQTRQGGRNTCSLYAMTWLSVDECKGKLDVSETKVPSNLWKPGNHHKIDTRHIEAWKKTRSKKEAKKEMEKAG